MNHRSRGSTANPSVPLSVARVARIVTEFCALVMPRNRATPCARRNKEFLTRAVFCLFNCCTDVVVRRVGCAHQPVPRRVQRGSYRQLGTGYRLRATDNRSNSPLPSRRLAPTMDLAAMRLLCPVGWRRSCGRRCNKRNDEPSGLAG